ncbi:hypothetical protein [Streptomyces sp. NPDC001508]|uniref:hypothetical protein n=1 Tax=Streptomyces sp. NPDC001508 TaxID=3154656 RepID=UPI00331FD577
MRIWLRASASCMRLRFQEDLLPLVTARMGTAVSSTDPRARAVIATAFVCLDARQLGHLLAVMTLPPVSLGIIPAGASGEGAMWPFEQFTCERSPGLRRTHEARRRSRTSLCR